MKREPVVLPLSILAGLGFLFAGITGITALSGYAIVAAIAACGSLAVAATQVGIQFWIRGQVTPTTDVGAIINDPDDDLAPVAAPMQDEGEYVIGEPIDVTEEHPVHIGLPEGTPGHPRIERPGE